MNGMNEITLNNRTPDTWSNASSTIDSSQLISNTKQTIKQNVTPLSTYVDKDKRALKSFNSSQTHDTGDIKQPPSPFRDSNVLISQAEVNYHRKVESEDVDMQWLYRHLNETHDGHRKN